MQLIEFVKGGCKKHRSAEEQARFCWKKKKKKKKKKDKKTKIKNWGVDLPWFARMCSLVSTLIIIIDLIFPVFSEIDKNKKKGRG